MIFCITGDVYADDLTNIYNKNRDNTPVKQSKRLSSDDLKKILHVCEHECNRPPDHIQYEHECLQTEQSALNQIKDLICCVYYTE